MLFILVQLLKSQVLSVVFLDYEKSQRSTDFHFRPGSCQFLDTSAHDSQTALCACIAALLFTSFFKGRVSGEMEEGVTLSWRSRRSSRLYGLFWRESFCFCGQYSPALSEIYTRQYKIWECVFAGSQIKGFQGVKLFEKGKELEYSSGPDPFTLSLQPSF